jgi:hypothetical protein
MPTEATDRTFGYLRKLAGLARVRYRWRLWRLSKTGVKEWKTVCEMTKWYVGEEIPNPPSADAPGQFDEALQLGFDELLSDLDLWLRAYGLVSGELEVGSVALHDLPAAVPWVVEISNPEGNSAVASGLLHLHDRAPNLAGATGDQDAAKEAGIIMAAEDKFPAFPALSLLFQAQSEARAGRGRQAVIDAGTAVEMLVLFVIGEVMRRSGEPEAQVEQLREEKWKNVFNRRLLEALSVPIGSSGPEHTGWWRNAYVLRVQAVHKGHRPSQTVALEVISQTWDLFEWIGDKLREREGFEDLAAAIPVERK